MKNLFKRKETSIFIFIIVLSGVITILNSAFLNYNNLSDLLRMSAVLGIVASGMLPVIITGNIDVSVGGMIAATAVLTGNFLIGYGGNLLLLFILSGLFGAILGSVNGFLVTRFKIPAIVVTLGTLNIFNGVSRLYTGGSWITGLPQSFISFGQFRFLGIPVQIWIWFIVASITFYILKYTVLGRGIFALGGNKEAAQRAGFKSWKIQLFTFSYLGLLVGIAAVTHVSIVRHVDVNAFSWFELDVIAAVVLGGASILGGKGSIFGTFLGVMLLQVIDNGLTLVRISSYWRPIFVGVIILVGITFDILQEKRKNQKRARIDVENERSAIKTN